MGLAGKTIIITGASKGIGARACRVFAEAGASVVGVARSVDELENLPKDRAGMRIFYSRILDHYKYGLRVPANWGPFYANFCCVTKPRKNLVRHGLHLVKYHLN